jgi:Ca-activated chloride channel family protein
MAAFVVLAVLGAAGGCVLREVLRDPAGRVVSRAGAAPYAGLPACPDQSRHTETLLVFASPEKAGLLHDLGQDYGNRAAGGTCFAVEVASKSSNDVARQLIDGSGTPPDVWSPASTRWLSQIAGTSPRLPSLNPPPLSLFTSPVVIAMPRPMAEAIGWPRARIGWRELAALAGDPRGWGAYGHPEWGPFRLGKTNPEYSTSGLSATIGIDYALTRQPGDNRPLTVEDVTDPATVTKVRDFEKSVVHYGRNTLAFLTNLRHATETLTYVSAVALEESSMISYNRGHLCGAVYLGGDQARVPGRPEENCERRNPPATPLVAVGPDDGVLVSDHPYLKMPGLSPVKKEVADDFLSFVHSERPQEKVGEAGFRGPSLSGDELLPTGVPRLPEPDPRVVRQILGLWPSVRKPANVVLAIDTSGSMKGTKIKLVRDAVPGAVTGFAERDRVGLWSFSSTHRPTVPPAPMTGAQRSAVTAAIDRLEPGGDTALYNTVAAAVDDVRARWDPGAINAVIVLTDGRDDVPHTIDLGTLTTRLTAGDRPVRVFTIAYGADADRDGLRRIAETTGASCYFAADTASITDAFTDVVSNF